MDFAGTNAGVTTCACPHMLDWLYRTRYVAASCSALGVAVKASPQRPLLGDATTTAADRLWPLLAAPMRPILPFPDSPSNLNSVSVKPAAQADDLIASR